MLSRLFATAAAAVGLALIAAVVLIGPASADRASRTFSTTLTGAAEVPGPGDPDGTGTASVTVRPGIAEVCYTLEVEGIEPATAAHVHFGEAGTAGPVVVTLEAPSDGDSAGCAPASRRLVAQIFAHPERYYVNVHNAEYPAGALRGQLGD
jgi:CHRD domain